MSSTDGQLCLNISMSSSVARPPRPRQRWGLKKRCRSTDMEAGLVAKQRRQRTPEGPGSGKGDRKKSDIIKTSSLFKHNPLVPDISRPEVSQVTEKIFSSGSFSDLDLHPHLVSTLNKVLNISVLTSVQEETIPVLLSGRDAVVRSQTGSGKTLCYAVPVVQKLQEVQPKVQRSDGPLAVVIVPTRELALQTFQTIQKLLKPFTWIVAGVLMGGEKRKAEKARIRKGINILVSTPGRLVDHIKHTLNISFSAVRWLILDEADRILDLGFEKDVTVILNSLNSSGPARQNVLLSATLTDGVTRLVDVCLKDPVSIRLSAPASSEDGELTVHSEHGQGFAVPEELSQSVVVVPSKVRLVVLAAFILDKCRSSQDNKVIIFVSSCEGVDFLHLLFTSVLLTNNKLALELLRLHGNMKQEERSDVYQRFCSARSGVLICTDVAARGLHLPQVTWIVQYTPPMAAVDYVHRVGRTARIGGAGSSLLFLTPAETTFISELATHNISLAEVKMSDILSSLMLDDTYKGRGKYHSQSSAAALEQEKRERATVLQTNFENFVHSSEQTLMAAKTALQSFLRAYATYPPHLRKCFHIRALHLGHCAKSFGLRDAPRGLSAAGMKTPRRRTGEIRARKRNPAETKATASQRDMQLLRSEFSSGLEGGAKRRGKKPGTAND
ncbi:ATP-dependent DNA helicase DDX31 isoform 1-T4 [Synchiropus picturatus]